MVQRVFVERHKELDTACAQAQQEFRDFLGVDSLTNVRILDRYDVEAPSSLKEPSSLGPEVLAAAVGGNAGQTVTEEVSFSPDETVFAVAALPAQYDQLADSLARTLAISTGDYPTVRTATIYALEGDLTEAQVQAIKDYVINPVESQEVGLDPVETLGRPVSQPAPVPILEGFIKLDPQALEALAADLGLAMDLEDLKVCQEYFQSERRDPTETELGLIDTYWSDHCRHTTFLTQLEDVEFDDPVVEATWQHYLQTRSDLGRSRPVTLMDLATIASRSLSAQGKLDGLDVSKEVNACTVKINVDTDEGSEPWLLLFKNETHNHPTEIEPFGGAATCLGGAIRDPLSGRAHVYGAMRITGAANPLDSREETLPGKLPQRTIVRRAADGYSSYGNQIGVASGGIKEFYHPGYEAKRMELGAVIAATPAENVVREEPMPGDVVILLGGKTGRDGVGGATGSSKSHTEESSSISSSEVQKGNPLEERKIMRLFRDPAATRLIKRSNDFGAGGVSVAIGELADGLAVDLDRVPVKEAGLSGTDLALSESQERMAVVVSRDDVPQFLNLAAGQDVEATVVAQVTETPRLTMSWRGEKIVDLSRQFLDSSGAPKTTTATVELSPLPASEIPTEFTDGFLALAADLNVASQEGLASQFDFTAGGGAVLSPLGGKFGKSEPQAMVQKIATLGTDTSTVSAMAFGFDPYLSSANPYVGAYLAVVESVAKLVATGADLDDTYLTFQEYFERLGDNPLRWGKPLAALLGAYRAQMELGVAAVGGKDSMSGSFEDLDVPPTLVSFAVTVEDADRIISPDFKDAGSTVTLLAPTYGEDGLPTAESLRDVFDTVAGLSSQGVVKAAYALGVGGVARGLLNMTLGNRVGISLDDSVSLEDLFSNAHGAFILELAPEVSPVGVPLGTTIGSPEIVWQGEALGLSQLQEAWEAPLQPIYPIASQESVPASRESEGSGEMANSPVAGSSPTGRQPRFLVPVFAGTTDEYQACAAIERAGGVAQTLVLRTSSAKAIADSVSELAAQIKETDALVLLGASQPLAASEIAAFLTEPGVAQEIQSLLDERSGLVLGVGASFAALLQAGLLPGKQVVQPPLALALNATGRHHSALVKVQVDPASSPWLANATADEVFTVPLSTEFGRFVASQAQLQDLAQSGQIAATYAGSDPTGSAGGVAALASPTGAVLGITAQVERLAPGTYRNVPGNFTLDVFGSAVSYCQQLPASSTSSE